MNVPSNPFGLNCGSGVRRPGIGKKIFVGRLPQEANVEDLRQYFSRFGRIVDVYVPKVTEISCFIHRKYILYILVQIISYSL